MWKVWVGICAWQNKMGQQLLSGQKHLLSRHYRSFFSTVLLAIVPRSSVSHWLGIQTGIDMASCPATSTCKCHVNSPRLYLHSSMSYLPHY